MPFYIIINYPPLPRPQNAENCSPFIYHIAGISNQKAEGFQGKQVPRLRLRVSPRPFESTVELLGRQFGSQLSFSAGKVANRFKENKGLEFLRKGPNIVALLWI